MQQILSVLTGWIPQAAAVLAFFTPDRCKALFDMVIRTIDYAKDLTGVNDSEQLYELSLDYARSLYDEWDEAEKYSDGVDLFVKNTLLPMVLGFVFGGNK